MKKWKKIYFTIGTVSKSQIVKTEAKLISLAHIHMTAHHTGLASIQKGGNVKLGFIGPDFHS
jgi:hypothetical protein